MATEELSATSRWLCRTCVAFRKLHGWQHGLGAFWWRRLELMRCRSSSCPTFFFLVLRGSVLDFFHMNNTQCQYPNVSYNLGIVLLNEVSQKAKIGDQLLRLFVKLENLPRLIQVLQTSPCSGDSLISESIFFDCLCELCLVVGLFSEYRSAAGVSVTSRYALVVKWLFCFLLN